MTNDTVYGLEVNSSNVYLGGTFTEVAGQPKEYLAVVDATTGALGSQDAAPDQAVKLIVSDGSKLFVSGTMRGIGGVRRKNLAGFDSSSASVLPFPLEFSSTVYDIAFHQTTMYAVGSFTSVDGVQRGHGAAVDIPSKSLLPWNPLANDDIHCLAVTQSDIWLGGVFTSLSGFPRLHLGQVNAASGLATSVRAGVDGIVDELLDASGVLYAGGSFGTAGYASNHWGQFDSTSGTATATLPDADGPIHDIAPDGSGGWFVAGDFEFLGGVKQAYLAHVTNTGAIDTTFAPLLDDRVTCLQVVGTRLFIGGRFASIDSTGRDRFAAIDITPGPNFSQLDPFNLGASGEVLCFAVDGPRLFVGGKFQTFGGMARHRVAAIDTATMTVDSFAPMFDNDVNVLLVTAQDLYVGGRFLNIGAQSRTRLCSFDLNTDALSAFNPSPNGQVHALAMHGSGLFVGGVFTDAGFQPRRNLAQIETNPVSPMYAQATSFQADASAFVGSLAIAGDLYVGGAFNEIGGVGRSTVAALNVSTGSVSAFDTGLEGVVNDLEVVGSNIVVAGSITMSSSRTQTNVAALNQSTNEWLGWTPTISNVSFSTSNPSVEAISLVAGKLFLGGRFDRIDGVGVTNFAEFYTGPLIVGGASLPDAVETVQYTYPLSVSGGLGPYTWSLSGQPAWVSINSATGELTGLPPSGSAPATFNFSVTVADSNTAMDSMPLSLDVIAVAPLVITTTSQLPDQYEGVPISGVSISSSGGVAPYVWSLSGAPAWLSINASTGALLGTPPLGSAPTAVNFTVLLDDGSMQNATEPFQFDIPVVPALQITTTSPLPAFYPGQSISGISLAATGGVGAYVWALQNGPTWLSINPSTGELNGNIPLGIGGTNIVFDVEVTDMRPVAVQSPFSLPVLVIPQPTITTSGALPVATAGVSYSSFVTVSGGQAPYLWQTDHGPSWLGINPSTGELSGVPTVGQLGEYAVSITVFDSFSPSQSAQANFTIRVTEAPCQPSGSMGWESKPNLLSGVNSPGMRWDFASVWTGSHIFVWGGAVAGSATNTGGLYNPATDTWVGAPNLNAGIGAPAARYNPGICWTGEYVVIWGGSGGSYHNTGGVYDPATDTWLSTPNLTNAVGAPMRRYGHSMVWTGRNVLIWGGRRSGGGNTRLDTGGLYDVSTDTWLSRPNLTAAVGAPGGRVEHSSVWTGKELLVWGGSSGAWPHDTGALYDPVTDTWRAPSGLNTNAPQGRTAHLTVWSGEKMIIWGGGGGRDTRIHG